MNAFHNVSTLRITDIPDLQDLLNIMCNTDDDDVCSDDSAFDSNDHVRQLSDHDTHELYQNCMHMIDEYMAHNPTAISDVSFMTNIHEELMNLLHVQLNMDTMDYFFSSAIAKEHMKAEVEDIVTHALTHYFEFVMPPRSYDTTFVIDKSQCQQQDLIVQINKLNAINENLHKQGTCGWYNDRNNMLTASNVYKAFESQSSLNSLIYEKCEAHKRSLEAQPIQQVFGESSAAFEWGKRYEPVSIMLYENEYNTTIQQFGCIPHPVHSFLGASPDGINSNQSNARFGRMIEIKNVVSRVIDGIPKKEYWIQMQIQMEVCDLDECDFLETKFTEYDTFNEFISDGSFCISADVCKKGIALQFADNQGNIKYEYKPIGSIDTMDEFDEWEANLKQDQSKNNYNWVRNCYWKLDTFSCVLVKRNREWFNQNIEQIRNVWKTIEHERIHGYTHRAPNTRQTQKPLDTNTIVCNKLL